MRSQMESKVKPVLSVNEKSQVFVCKKMNIFLGEERKKIKNDLKGNNGKNEMK
jgi:hypothetical protein